MFSFVGCRFQIFARNLGPQFLVGDLQLYLNLQSVVMKNDGKKEDERK